MSAFTKWLIILTCGILLIIKNVQCADPQLEEEELRAIDFLRYMDDEMKELTKKNLLATFNYETNMTRHNRKSMVNATIEVNKRMIELWKELNNFSWRTYKDQDVKRQFWLRSFLGTQGLTEVKFKKLNKLSNEMKDVLLTVNVCAFDNPKNCNLTLNPDIGNIFAKSENPIELQHTYIEYVKAAGQKIKPFFKESIDLLNESASHNGFKNVGDEWIARYEDPQFKKHVADLYKDLKPLYAILHAYVRHKLRTKYGDVVSKNGPIPIHLTGGLYGNSFERLYDMIKPFPNVTNFNYDRELTKQKYNTDKIFKIVEDFYTSLNMSEMPELFWNKSILEKSGDREMSCNGAAYYIDEEDLRIKMCTKPTKESLKMAFHEMGQIEYFLQFDELPQVYRSCANEGFCEAVGDSVATSFFSLTHLKEIKLFNAEVTEEILINNGFLDLLNIVPGMMFAYAVESWRWNVFTGNITDADYNCPWWKMVEELQGLEPPTDRCKADFDISIDNRIVTNIPYIKDFTAKILQYQFYKSMCLKSKQYKPNTPGTDLYKCDFHGNSEVGIAMKAMMSLGSSKPWPDALEVLTGQRYMDTSAILEYFKPVQMWLEDEIDTLNIPVGWIKSTKACH